MNEGYPEWYTRRSQRQTSSGRRPAAKGYVSNLCRSDWAFEHSGLNFDQRLGFCLRSQSERPYSYRTPDNSVFLWSICLFTQCIRNQHFQIFLLQVKGLGVQFRMQVHVLSTWTYPCVVWTRCSHQQFDSWSQLSGLWTVMLHPFGILSVGGFHAATRFMRGWVWAFLTFPYLYSLVEELVKFSRDLGTTS